MFKRSLCVILSLSLLCLAGCSFVENFTFEELMEEVNAKHQEVEAVDVNVSDYIGDLVDDEHIKLVVRDLKNFFDIEI